jgi:hypothetical protein
MKVLGKVFWLWNRLRCMSLLEVIYRLYHKGHTALQKNGLFTVSSPPEPDLKAIQINWIQRSSGFDQMLYTQLADRTQAGNLCVFATNYVFDHVPNWNYDASSRKSTPLTFGKSSDYRDPEQFGDIKYVWEPNRHLHLVPLAQAFVLTGNKAYGDTLARHLQSWFEQCPYLLGANWVSSLELGIRLINWSIVWQLIGGKDSLLFTDNNSAKLKAQWLDSIYQHCHFINGHWSKYSSANNHLIGEASGLLIASITWPYWPESEIWLRKASEILNAEAGRQNYDDGVNKEQAISYQQFVLDFLLFAGLTARAGGQDFPESYWRCLEKMIDFIASVMDVNGNMPMIGDADDGYVSQLSPASDFCPYRSLLATGAVLFKRADFKAKAEVFDDKSRWLLGDQGEKLFAELSGENVRLPVHKAFASGGYYILGTDFETPSEIRLLADAGQLGYLSIAAHGHADALAVTLSLGGWEFLIDPGTYAYHTEKQWRDYFRGTSAHNTVRVDGLDQSVPGGNFMWIRHAQASCDEWRENDSETVFCGQHDGYQRLPDPVLHRREICLDKLKKSFLITDTLVCQQTHTVERFWHFSELCAVSVGADGRINAENGGFRVDIRPLQAVLSKTYRGDVSGPLGWVSRRYAVKEPTTTVVWSNEISGKTEFGALIECKLS